jgi:hypothetical protein
MKSEEMAKSCRKMHPERLSRQAYFYLSIRRKDIERSKQKMCTGHNTIIDLAEETTYSKTRIESCTVYSGLKTQFKFVI